MSSWYLRDCGHLTLRAPWGDEPETRLDGICVECRAARIGSEIDFIRHGELPEAGHSRNHRDDTAEEGVSVYEIVNGQPKYVGWHFEISQRPAIYGRGTIIGWGSDGEPLVRVTKLTARKR